MMHPGYDLELDPDDYSALYVLVVRERGSGKKVARFGGKTQAEVRRKADKWIDQQWGLDKNEQ